MCLSNEVCAFGFMCLSNKVCAFANHRKKHINPNWDEWKFVTFKKKRKAFKHTHANCWIITTISLFLFNFFPEFKDEYINKIPTQK